MECAHAASPDGGPAKNNRTIGLDPEDMVRKREAQPESLGDNPQIRPLQGR
jgi:hypothetical protein